MAGRDEEAEQLYGLPLEEFTEARNARARKLRKDGDRDAAEAVGNLAKPTRAAWVANQLSRRHGKEMDALLRAGDELRAAHERLVGGDRDADVAGAAAREREAVGRLVERARSLDLSDAVLERVAETLHAAAGSEDVRDRLRRGALVREEQAAMFGGLAVGAAPAGETAPTRGTASARGATRRRRKAQEKRDTGAGRAERERAERAERERAERAERERRERLKAAQAELRRLRSEHGRAQKAAESAGRRVEQARQRLAEREDEADAARAREEEARHALSGAEREVERLER